MTGLSSQQRAAAHQPTGMVREVCVPSGADFKGSDFDVLQPDHPRAVEYTQLQTRRNIAGSERVNRLG